MYFRTANHCHHAYSPSPQLTALTCPPPHTGWRAACDQYGLGLSGRLVHAFALPGLGHALPGGHSGGHSVAMFVLDVYWVHCPGFIVKNLYIMYSLLWLILLTRVSATVYTLGLCWVRLCDCNGWVLNGYWVSPTPVCGNVHGWGWFGRTSFLKPRQ